MANTIRIRRRASGLAGAPSSLRSGEVAFNEVDGRLYYGKGDDGNENATSIIQINIEEAPQDGNYYVRQNGAWVNLITALDAVNNRIIDGSDTATGVSLGDDSTIDGGNIDTGVTLGDNTLVDGGAIV